MSLLSIQIKKEEEHNLVDASKPHRCVKCNEYFNEAQMAKIKPIFEKTGAQLKALRDNTSLPAQQERQKMRQIFAASAQQIRPILTPQQLQKWKQIREERHTATTST